MKTMKWLLRREFWEHKGAMAWAPLIVGALMVLLVGTMAVYGASMGKLTGNITVVRDDAGTTTTTTVSPIATEQMQQLATTVSDMYMAAAMPLILMMSVIAFFYCLAAMHDERRDRSILFWKSLPVSDTQTVLSKVVTAAIVFPAIAVGTGIVVSLVMLLIVGILFAVNGVNMFGMVLSNANFYLAPLRLIGLLPVYLVWALPTIGWLMMVSAWARSKVFLWAVGTPVIFVVIVKWADYLLHTGINIDWLVENVISRGLIGLFPGTWMPLTQVDPHTLAGNNNIVAAGNLFTQSWMTLAHPAALIGAIAGVAMIVAAIRLRRWKDEG
jgi:ABC-2 type transport system permease protein